MSLGQEALKKTLYGAPAGSVFLDFDQKRALSRPERLSLFTRTDGQCHWHKAALIRYVTSIVPAHFCATGVLIVFREGHKSDSLCAEGLCTGSCFLRLRSSASAARAGVGFSIWLNGDSRLCSGSQLHIQNRGSPIGVGFAHCKQVGPGLDQLRQLLMSIASGVEGRIELTQAVADGAQERSAIVLHTHFDRTRRELRPVSQVQSPTLLLAALLRRHQVFSVDEYLTGIDECLGRE